MYACINVQSHQLLAEKTLAALPQVVANTQKLQFKNMEQYVELYWVFVEFHVADPVAGSVMTLCLDNGRDYDRILSMPDKIKT